MKIYENKADNEAIYSIIKNKRHIYSNIGKKEAIYYFITAIKRKIEICKSCGKHYEKINEVREICHRCTRWFTLLINEVKKHGTKICDYY